MADLFYYETGYIDEKYFGYVADAGAQLAPYFEDGYIEVSYYEEYGTTSSLSCDATKTSGQTVEGYSDWSASFTQSATAYKIVPVVSSISVSATQSASAGKIVDDAIAVDAAWTSSITAIAFKNHTAVLDTTVTMTTDAVATRSANVLLEHIADLNAMAAKTAVIDSTLTITSTQTSSATTLIDSNATLSTSVSLSCNALNIQYAAADIAATSSVYASRYLGTGRPRNISGGTYSTTYKKFGTASLESSNAVVPDSQAITSGYNSSQSVIQGWVHFRSTSSAQTFAVFGITGGTAWDFSVLIGGAVRVRTYYKSFSTGNRYTGPEYTTSSNSTNTWYHWAVVNNGSTISYYWNGTRVGTADSIDLWPTTGIRVNGSSGVINIDDFSIHRGTTLGYNPSSTSITVPTTATVNDPTYTQALYHFDENGLDDIWLTQSASASLTNTATVSASALANYSASSTLTSSSTITASGTGIVNGAASLSAFNATVAIAINIKASDINLSSSSSLSILAGLDQSAESALSTSTSVSADVARIRTTVVSIDAQVFQVDVGRRVRYARADLSASFTESAAIKKYAGVASSLSATVSQSVSFDYSEADWNQRKWMRGIKGLGGTTSGLYEYNYRETDSMAIDITGDKVYELHYLDDTDVGFVLVKRGLKDGEVIWTKKYITTAGPLLTDLIFSDGKLYFAVSTDVSVITHKSVVYVYDTNSDVLTPYTTHAANTVTSIAVENGDIYVGGYSYGSPSIPTLTKLNSSGVKQWSKSREDNIYADISSIIIDSTYVYFALTDANSNNSDFVKVNKSTGAYVSSKRISNLRSGMITKDADGNLFLYGLGTSALTQTGTVMKVDTSWNILINKKLSQTGSLLQISKIKVADDGLYLITPTYIMKISSDLSSCVWSSGFTYESYTNPDPHITRLYDIDFDTNKLYWIGRNSLTNPTLSITSKVLRTDSEPYWDNFGFREGVTVKSSTSAYGSGSWSHQSQDPATFATGTASLSDIATFTWSTVSGSNTAPTVTYDAAATYADYQYFYVVYAIGSLAATTSVTAIGGKFKGTSVALSSSSSLAVDFKRYRDTGSNLTVTAAESATAVKTARTSKDLAAAFTQTANNKRVRYNSSSISAAFTESTDAVKRVGTTVDVSAAFTSSTQVTRRRNTSIAITALHSEVAVVAKNATGTVLLETTSSLVASPVKNGDLISGMSSAFTQDTEIRRFVGFEAAINSNASVTAEGLRVQAARAAISATTSLTANTANSKITRVTASQSTTTTLSATPRRIRGGVSLDAGEFALVCNNKILRLASAGLTDSFTILASPTFIVRINAELTGFYSSITVGDVINIDPYYKLVIQSEGRGLIILPETRVISIEQETRVNII